jgi:hypothetical protein
MQILSKLLFASTLILCISSCKKKEDNPPDNAKHTSYSFCQVTDVVRHFPGGCTDSIELIGPAYQIAGTISFDNCYNGTPGPVNIRKKNFIYEHDRIYLVDSLASFQSDTLFVDPVSHRILEDHNRIADTYRLTGFEYDADGLLQRSVTSVYYHDNLIQADTSLFSYENGDLVMQVGIHTALSRDTIRYTYYTDQKVPSSSYLTQTGLGYGSSYTIRNAHLLKGEVDEQGVIKTLYTYKSDNYGNITKVIRTDGTGSIPIDTTVYHYMCIVD